MPSFETLFTFGAAALLLSLSPGPSNLYIMARSMGQGHQSGIAAAGGMAVGSFAYVFATALGLAAVFAYSPLAYLTVKLAGAAYLIYLGIQHIRSTSNTSVNSSSVKTMTMSSVFRQSVVVELTNPKTALFFLAFLPQFVDAQRTDVVMQLLVLGTVYAVIAFCSDLFVVLMSSTLGKWLSQHPMFVEWQDRISGGILLGLGAYIAFDELKN